MRRRSTRRRAGRWFSHCMLACLGLVTGCGDDGPSEPDPVTLADLFGTQLLMADGTEISVGSLEQNTLIGIYFMSTGCPACNAFNPVLVPAYDQMKQNGNPFEIVMVTQGITSPDLVAYMSGESMGWTAVAPLGDLPTSLSKRYQVQWVPTLIIIRKDGTVVSWSGREQVSQNGAEAWDLWAKGGTS